MLTNIIFLSGRNIKGFFEFLQNFYDILLNFFQEIFFIIN